MPITAILLVLLSSILHVLWNYIAKQKASAAFYLLCYATGALLFSPILIINADTTAKLFIIAWPYIVTAGLCEAVAFFSLSIAYKKGDFSIIYPISRSLPMVFLLIIHNFTGIIDEIYVLNIFGIILVVFGSFVVPHSSFKSFVVESYLNRSFLYAILCACAITGYSYIDDFSLRLLSIKLEDKENPKMILSMIYLIFQSTFSFLFLFPLTVSRQDGRENLLSLLKNKKRLILLTGLLMYVTYVLVLVAMSLSRNVSYVVSFRQISIPLGALVGFVLLKEKLFIPKLIGLALICCGLVLVIV